MQRSYWYVGSPDLAVVNETPPARASIYSSEDVRRWLQETGQSLGAGREVTATFVIDLDGRLWIADRHSEHVQCARGGRVLSAGEMTFRVEPGGVAVAAVSNQSTGYCPEPESWPAVAAALDAAGLDRPEGFTTEFVFRRCPGCGIRNVVKEGWYECGACGAPLPQAWNCASEL
jgi:hypothetical protein